MFRLVLRKSSRSLRYETEALATPFLLHLPFKSLSTATKTSLSAADYLSTSLGVSRESALRIGTKFDLRSVSNADSVVDLFKEYGFNQTHIAEIASKNIRLFTADPHKTLKPKLDFFVRIGISGDALSHLITDNPALLHRSLNKRIAPCIDFLRRFFGRDRDLVSIFALRRWSIVVRYFSEDLPTNFETLRRFGVPDENIVNLIVFGCSCLGHDADIFERNVKEIAEMGLDPLSPAFVRGVSALSNMDKGKRAAKVEVFKSFGWSEEMIWKAFMKQPTILTLSEERLKRALEIFSNRMQWSADELCRRSSVLTRSLDKRVLPRLALLEILISKGLEDKACIYQALMMTEASFLNKLVIKHLKDVPQLLELYRKKVSGA